ncbi:hypothetical protein B296_00006338, partial [Ensete ventricosum]
PGENCIGREKAAGEVAGELRSTESDCGGGCSTAERHHTALEEEEDRRFDMGWMEELQSALAARGLAVASIPGKGRGLITTRDFAPGESPFLPRPSLGTTRLIFGQQLLDEKSLPCSTSIGFLILLSSVVMRAEEFSERNTLDDILVTFEIGQNSIEDC